MSDLGTIISDAIQQAILEVSRQKDSEINTLRAKIEELEQERDDLNQRVQRLENKHAVYGPIKRDLQDDPLYQDAIKRLKEMKGPGANDE